MKRLLHYSIMFIIVISLLLSGAFNAITEVHAANPAPVQVYYVTLPETDGLRVLDSINTAANPPMYTYFSISVAVTGTYIYYDQKENGYALDLANPTSAESTVRVTREVYRSGAMDWLPMVVHRILTECPSPARTRRMC